MDVGSLFVKLGLSVEDFERGMKAAEGKLQNFGKAATKAGKDLSMKVTAPITLLGVSTLKTAGDFESAMNRVAAISGATGSQLEAMTEQARELGATTQFSASQAADAMTFLSMAGFQANEIMEAMPSTLTLAAAAQLDMGTAADIVSNIMSGFGMNAEELSGAVDVLTKQFTTSNTNLQQLGEAMKYAAPVAASLGVSIQEASAAIGIMSDAGIQASMAGTGLRGILSTLAQDGKKLGVNVFDASGQMRPFADILEELGTKGLSTSKIMEVFGERAGPAMLTLLSAGSKAMRDQISVLEQAGGTAERIADTQMQGLNGQLKALRSAFEELQLAIGESGLLNSVTSFAKRLTEVIRNLSQTNPQMLKMGVIAAGLAAAIGPVLIVIGQMSLGLAAVVRIMPVLIAHMVRFLNVAKANPFGLIATGIALALPFILRFADSLRKTGNEMSLFDDIQKRASESTIEQTAELNKLFDIVKYGEKGTNRYKDAVKKLNDLYPSYLANLDIEKASLEDINKVQNQIVAGIKQKAVMAIAEEELKKQYEAQAKTLLDLQNAQEDLAKERERQAKYLAETTRAEQDLQSVYEDFDAALDPLTYKVDQLSGTYVAQSLNIKQLEQRYGEVIERMTDLTIGAEEAKKELEGLANGFRDTWFWVGKLDKELSASDLMTGGFRLEADDIIPADDMLITGLEARGQALIEFANTWEDATAQIAGVTQAYLVDGLSAAFAQMGANMASGVSIITNVKNIVLGTLADLAIQVGKIAIGVGLAVEGIKKALQSLNPIAALAAGVALVTLGGIAKAALARSAEKAGGVPAFADGGIVSGPTLGLMGEYAGARSNPEVIAPLNKLQSMMGGVGGEVTFRIEGRELVGILSREGSLAKRV